VKDPCQISNDELEPEFLICKYKIELLEKHTPYFRLKFLTSLVTDATSKGNTACASKLTGVIHKERSRKQWGNINKTTTVAVKIPTADGGYNEYNTKEGVHGAVSPIILEWFQSVMAAQCHQRKFFEDIGHLADGPVAQQILEGTYVYPPDLDQATRLLFEEATATYAALSPTAIKTYVTPDDFQYFLAHSPRTNRILL
jgi:hypothetical protein